MALKNVYKEIEEDKKKSVSSKTVSMDLDEYVDEHRCLIEILREGSREELLAEAEEQEEELEECLKEHGLPEDYNEEED